MRLKIGHKLCLIICVLASFVLVNSLFLFLTIKKAHISSEEVADEIVEMAEINIFAIALTRLIMTANDFLIHGDVKEINNYTDIKGVLHERLLKIDRFITEDYSDIADISEYKRKMVLIENYAEQIFNLAAPVGNANGASIMEKMDTLADEIIESANAQVAPAIIEHLEKILTGKTQELRKVFFVQILLLVNFILIGLGVAFFFSRNINKALNKLVAGAAKIAKGDFSHTLKIDTGDELEILSSSFNQMSKNLQKTTVSRDKLLAEVEQRQKAENTAQLAIKEWERTFNSISDFIFVQDKNFTILNANKPFCDLLKLAPKDVIGKKCYNLLHNMDKPWPGCPFDETKQDNKAHTEEVNDPNIGIPLLVTVSPIFDNEGKLSGSVHIAKDISKLKEMELELMKSDVYIETMGDALIVLNAQRKITKLNKSALELLGYAKEEVFALTFEKIFPEKEHEKHFAEMKRAAETETAIYIETALLTKNGKEIPVLLTGNALKDKKGDLAGFVGVCRNITELKKALEMVHASERKYQALFENLPQKIFVKDRDSVYISCNNNYAKDLKIKASDIAGKTDHDFFPKEMAEQYMKNDKKVIETGKTSDIEEKYLLSGKETIIETVKTPLKDFSGNSTGILGIFWDITERKWTEQKLDQTLKEAVRSREITLSMLEDNNQIRKELEGRLQELNEAQAKLQSAYTKLKQAQSHLIQAEKMEAVGRMASGVAHEVKNPLGIVLQSINFLEEKMPTQQKQTLEVFKMAKDNIERANTIVCSLVDFSRATELDLKPTDLNAIVKKSLMLIKHRVKLDNIKVITKLEKNLPEIMADKGKIEQVFINTFLNAAQAMSKGGKLTITTYSAKGNISVDIEDTGDGIPKSVLDKIFDPFFSTKGLNRGTGLGLSVTKSIIEMHGGTITVESEVGKGTKFKIILQKA